MNRLTRRMAPFFVLLLAVGCSTEPTADLRNGVSTLLASPSQVFVELGKTAQVEVTAVDSAGDAQDLSYEVTAVGNGITVVRDSTFRPVFLSDTLFAVPPTATSFRFNVIGTAYTKTSFTVSAGGKDVVVPVQVAPVTQIAATFSNATPALGDTVTLTAPAGTTFTQTAELQIAGAADSLNPRIVERDPAGTFVRFLAPPNVNAQITITEVISDAAPNLIFTPATSDRLNTPLIDSVDVTYSTTTPTLGQTVTVTSTNPLIRFRPDVASSGPTLAGINFPGQLTGPLRGPDDLHLKSGAGPQNVTVAADSSSVTFDAPPNAAGPATVVSFVFPGGFSLPLPTRTGITAPNIGTTIAATFSNNTPAILQPVTITAPAGFVFGPLATDTVTFGDKIALNQSGGGGSSITVIPLPGSIGPATISGVVPSAAPQFALTLPTVDVITVPNITPLEGTDNIATAPTITIPTVGNSITLNDAGAFGGVGDCCFGGDVRFYKFTLAAPTTLSGTLDWFEGQDLGLYWVAADGVTAVGNFDGDSQGAGGHPESSTVTLTAGTYFVGVVNFGPGTPSFFQLTLHNP